MFRRRSVRILSVFLAVLGGAAMGPLATPASAANDYPWQDARAYSSGSLSPLRFAYRNCTDFAAWRLNVQMGRTSMPWAFTWSSLAFPNGDGNARGWKQGAINSGYRVDSTPAVGAVAWWAASGSRSSYGHVGIVTKVNSNGSVDIEAYNGLTEVFAPETGVNADAYLHIADAPNDRIAYIASTGQLYFKGALHASPVLVTNAAKAVDIDGGRIAYIASTGQLYFKGSLHASPVLVTDAATAVDIQGDSIAYIASTGQLYFKGSLHASPVLVTNASRVIRIA
jgi:surface antigen